MDEAPPYEAMLQALPGFLAHITTEGRILYLNRLAPGFTADQLRGSTIYDYTHPVDHGVIRTSLERAVATRAQTGFSSVAQGGHGEHVPYYTMLSPVIEGDRVASLVLLATDVSHVVDAHQALAASEAKLRVALEATGLGIWRFDPKRGEVQWDATISALHGYPPEPRVQPNATSSKHVHPDDLDRVTQEITASLLSTGRYGPIQHRIIRVDGSIGWVSASGQAQGSASPNPGSVVGGVMDITARKLAEERLAQAERLESIGRLAGGVAHDFNNMLTAILGYADLCLGAVEATAPIAEDLREIKRAADRSRELTSRLLMFARRQRGQPRVVDPNLLVQQLERLLQRIVGEDVALVSTRHAARNIRVDANQLEQLLVNLVTNARDAMPRGGRLAIDTLDLDVTVSDDELAAGPCVRIRVADTGAGIAPALLPHIFEPFVTTKGPNQGTGLGLAQCYGIARHHGGRLRIASTVGVGTEVLLDLPAVCEPAAIDETAAAARVGGDETILLVEDEAPIRTLLARLLRDSGYLVHEAASAEAALELAAHRGAIDLLITDMVMTGRSGIELATELQRTRPTLAVLVMSGYSPQLDKLGDTLAFLQKPFVPDELLAKIRAVLSARGSA